MTINNAYFFLIIFKMVKRTRKKKPDIEEDVFPPPRRRRYTRCADTERNKPVVRELLSRQTHSFLAI